MLDAGGTYFKKDNEYYCGDCAFINGFIDAQSLMKDFYYFIALDNPGVPIIKNGIVEIVTEAYIKAKENDDFRRIPEYIKWRKSVFERDNYTCQKCNQKGGKLNAHHIKPFSKYKELRMQIKNGITLCEKCHKLLHKKKDIKW
jgi:hypothetical protein